MLNIWKLNDKILHYPVVSESSGQMIVKKSNSNQCTFSLAYRLRKHTPVKFLTTV